MRGLKRNEGSGVKVYKELSLTSAITLTEAKSGASVLYSRSFTSLNVAPSTYSPGYTCRTARSVVEPLRLSKDACCIQPYVWEHEIARSTLRRFRTSPQHQRKRVLATTSVERASYGEIPPSYYPRGAAAGEGSEI
jgi:hypothetical protein